MRVSDHQLFGSTAGSLERIKERIVRVHEQIASQQRISKPSDDPNIFGQAILEQSALADNEQWIRNIQFGTARVTRPCADVVSLLACTASSRTRLIRF